MEAFDVLGEPVRRRILELLADGEQPAGAVSAVVQREFGISQPAVSQHLKVLRDSGFATVRAEGTRRLYAVRPQALDDIDAWLDRLRHALDADLRRPGYRAGPRPARPPPRGPTTRRRGGLMIDATHQISAVDRRVGTRTLPAGEARVVTLGQAYPDPIDDVWDACTNPERIPRWFLPDLRRPAAWVATTSSRATPAARSSAATRPRASPSRGSSAAR